ncbi:MAG: hypothetical protein LBE20_03020 [Deltaproteobacteria bacterium]|nr:hypothetical protein [Deltaproteobacteria bacterium]
MNTNRDTFLRPCKNSKPVRVKIHIKTEFKNKLEEIYAPIQEIIKEDGLLKSGALNITIDMHMKEILFIDQPEENLDNESIYKLLVPAIKEARNQI